MIDKLLSAAARRVLPFAFLAVLAAGATAGPAGPGTYAQLHAFQGLDGRLPASTILRGSDGVYYGTTSVGGAHNAGTIFRMTSDGVVTRMYSFDSFLNGAGPMDGLVEGQDGRLYGTASAGGSAFSGVVFAITKQGKYTVLHDFGDDGASAGFGQPQGAPVFGPDGALYGTTQQGGSADNGLVWRMLPDGSAYSILWEFTQANEPRWPSARLLVGSDGYLYGTSTYGGNGTGTVFKVAPNGGGRRVLYAFAGGTDGAGPVSPMLEGRDGKLYGVTEHGGNFDDFQGVGSGTVFTLSRQGRNYRQLVRFSAAAGDPIYPTGGLIEAVQDGVFYACSGSSGILGNSVLFRVRRTDGRFQDLYAFGSIENDGMDCRATLTRDVDGSYLSTTFYGGIPRGMGDGTIFRWTPKAP
jgi:uncharacterized repeat protein (TIGR03803 family)